MTKEKTAKPRKLISRFSVGLLIYVWVLLIAGGACLFMLWNYLNAFEDSRPQYCVEAYGKSLRERLPEAAAASLEGMDPLVMPPEETQRWAAELLADASFTKDPSRSDEQSMMYQVRAADGQLLGEVLFAVQGEGRFHMPLWGVAGESYDFSAYARTTSVTVPSDYQVYLGERLLGPEYVVETGIPYQELAECYLHYSNLPYMVRYESMPFVGEPQLHILDENGREVPPERMNESAFLDRCPQELRPQADEFMAEFIRLFVNFTADIYEEAPYHYFNELKPMIVMPHSQIYELLKNAFEGFGWSSTRSVDLLEVHIDHICALGGGRYLADVRYTTEATGYGGTTVLDDHLQIVLVDSGGKLLADALYYAA